jgi:transposase
VIPKASALYVARMEDILDLYSQSYDLSRPVVCMDEMPVGLTSASRKPLPARPGDCAKHDYEYVRHGSACVFGALDLKGGTRAFQVTQSRTGADFARFLKILADEVFPWAKTIRLVLDNLSTHNQGSFYEAFPPEEARRLAQRFEFHYTPTHGSWLNAVELEFAAAKTQCLKERTGTTQELETSLKAWQDLRNQQKLRVRWTFEISHAREKLKRLYPTNEA